jgi:rhodanese-related sulfurtransferase
MTEVETTEQGTAVDPGTAAELISDGAQPVDVRGDDEYAAGHIAGATHIRLDRLTRESPELAPDRPVVFYCRAGNRSDLAAGAFRASGWEAYHIEGGLLAWADAGRPLEPEDGAVVERSKLPGS